MKLLNFFKILIIGLVPFAADAGIVEFQIFNTGVDNEGNSLTHGASEQHYEIISGPIVTINPVVFKSSGGYPIGPWLGDSNTSAWISPLPSVNVSGDFIYKTTFDLTGFDPNTAQIAGLWTSDNLGTGVLLNGDPTADSFNFSNQGNFTALDTSFNFNSGFIEGINTLFFKLNNAPLDLPNLDNPTGLRVEFTLHTAEESIAQAPVPLPAAFWMFFSGLLTLTGYRKYLKE